MLNRAWVYLKETPTWVWFLLFVLSVMFTTHALRHNNFQMVKLRNAVYASDKTGSGVDQALNDLRAYVYGHMNTDLSGGDNVIKPPIQLKYTYDRLIKAEQERINTANEQILRDGANYCAKREAGKYRQVCVEAYSKQHSVKAHQVPAALYQFDFASPPWSPDAAGWGLVASIGLGLITIVSFVADRQAAFRVKHHRRTKV